MLPGLIAGHYTAAETHIDLDNLARRTGSRLVVAEACGLDRTGRRVMLRDGSTLDYDVVSLDIGATPRTTAVPGAAEHTVGVKPVDRLAERWEALVGRVGEAPRVVVVGGGAAGVELALAIRHRLPGADLTLVTGGDLLPGHNARVRKAFHRALERGRVTVRTGATVERVEAGVLWVNDGAVRFDEALWATEAGAAPWLQKSGLALDAGGFVAVDACLRSMNDTRVFAAGDIAAVLPHPRAKAGVIAVRQGPPLATNLRAVLEGREPAPFTPQRRWLSLVSAGGRRAVASYGPLCVEGRWVWWWKHHIDRRFMRRYR